MSDRQLKKEYALYSDSHSVDYKTELDTYLDNDEVLRLNTYQAFVANLFSPETELDKILLVHGTGTGKTLTSLSVAKKYLDHHKESPDDVRNIIIVGFTHSAFKRELISHPVFGFLSQEEMSEIRDLSKEGEYDESALAKLSDTKKAYLRRISKKKNGGIFRFFGYKQLFNRIINPSQYADLIAKGTLSARPTMSEVMTQIDSGKLDVNYKVIDDLRNSLIICDEIHNVYNGEEQNSWGIALLMIIDRFNDPSLPSIYKSIRIMYLSATPLTTSPTEIVPMLNLLNNKKDRIKENDVFDMLNIDEPKITPKGAALVKRLLYDKVSYVMDNNKEQYPSAHFSGDPIKGIEYLKFVRSKMSPFAEKTYNISISDHRDEDSTTATYNLSSDIILPSITSSTDTGTFDYDKFSSDLTVAGNQPKMAKMGLSIGSNGTVIGDIFKLSNIEKYSAKYYRMLQDLEQIRKDRINPSNDKTLASGKVFIYHPYVVASGVNMIANILSVNGYLNETESPGQHSICMVCDKTYKDHSTKSDHQFAPVRYMTVTGYMNKSTINSNLFRFNRPENKKGDDVMILIGSRTMRESHTLKAIRCLMVMRCPNSISEMIQIIGRGVRKHSHSALDPMERTTEIRVYTAHTGTGSVLSKEEQMYKDKMIKYKEINAIENIMFDVSMDYLVNFRFKKQEMGNPIGMQFRPNQVEHDRYSKALLSINTLREYTHNAFFIETEISTIKLLIKRIFLEYQRVLTYDDLYEIVLDPPFSVEMNTSLLSKSSFAVALAELTYDLSDYYQINSLARNIGAYYNSVMGDNKVFMDANRNKYVIVSNKGLYVLHDLQRVEINRNGIVISNQTKSNIGDQSPYELYTDINNNTWTVESVNLMDMSNRIDDYITPLEQIMMISKKKLLSSHGKLSTSISITQHVKLCEYLIQMCNDIMIKGQVPKEIVSKTISIGVVIQLLEFYQDTMNLITVSDTADTTIASDYKHLLSSSGMSWKDRLTDVCSGKGSKKMVNMDMFPIGHYLCGSPRLLKNDEWIEYLTIHKYQKYTHPYSFIGIDTKMPDSIASVFKIKFLDQNSKGIAITSIEKDQMVEMARELKLTIKGTNNKVKIAEMLRARIIEIETQLRSKKTTDKIYYTFRDQYDN